LSQDMVRNLLKVTLAGAVVGFLGYCIYFDRKRRGDPEFRAKLAKRRRARALAAQKASMPVLPSMNDPRAIHKFFLEQIQQGENALSTGCIDEAVQHFAYAVVVCGQPTQLLQVLQQSLSPGVFSKLVASLPEVRKVVTSTINPFEMFPGSGEFARSDQTPFEVEPLNRAHTLLVRSLWQQLKAAFPEGFESLSYVDVGLRCRLSREDILLIKRFVENKPEFPIPSTDSVNEIFSRFIEPVPEETEPFSFEIRYEYALIFVPFLIYIVCRKVGAIITTTMAIIVFAAYELYVQAIAKRHALLSRLPSVPDHCLPYSKQSFMSRFFFWKSSRSSEDECIEYFKLIMTSPFAELRPDRIILSVLGDFARTVASTAGASVGEFYYKLNSWAPFFIAFPLTVVSMWLLVRLVTSQRKPKPSKSRKLNKNRSVLPLKQE
uniref:Mitochondrial import receptor subunit TOM20 n=1 Tax=Taenia asiatica TaxID=60517 RepID=A0A0R3W3A8_TAEAS